jgi:hypothetical protein
VRRKRSVSLAGANGLDDALAFEDEDSSFDSNSPISDTERAMRAKIGPLRSRLREVMMVQHSAYFLAGSAWHKCVILSQIMLSPSLELTRHFKQPR